MTLVTGAVMEGYMMVVSDNQDPREFLKGKTLER